MNKLFKRTLNIVLIGIMVFAMNIVALAQGTTTISVSKSSAAVGDSITVSVTASESGTITVKYTSSMLTLSSCSVSGYSSQGNSVTFDGKTGDLVFSATTAGTASIIVSSSSCSGSSTTLTIGGGSSSAPAATTEEPAAEPEPAEEPVAEEPAEVEVTETPETTASPSGSAVGTLNADGGFDINGVAYVVSERYKDNEIPSGFDKTTIKIGSSTYSELTNGVITLLYLKPADNTSGSGVFYVYDEAAGTVSNFVMLGSADKYVLVQDSAEGPGSGFSQAVINVDGKDISCYTMDGTEFFYVYGQNQDQVEGWFVYDQTYGTVSRMDSSVLNSSVESGDDTTEAVETTETDANSSLRNTLSLYRKIIMGLIILCVILLFFTINRAIKNRGEDDDFDGDVFAKSPVKTSRRLPRSIVFNNPDEEDEEDDEYEDEEIFEDEDDDFSTSEGSYEERRDASLNMMDLNDL